MDPKTEKVLEEHGWTVECESPLEIRHDDGTFATGRAAQNMIDSVLKDAGRPVAKDYKQIAIDAAVEKAQELVDQIRRYGHVQEENGIARDLEDILEVVRNNGVISRESLSLRNTHQYVGTCRDMDDWDHIGTVNIMESLITRDEDDEDPCDSATLTYVCTVELDPRWLSDQVLNDPDPKSLQKLVEKALYDTFTSHGCHCEHDCCGCRSYSVRDVQKETVEETLPCGVCGTSTNYYTVKISTSRNY